MNLTRTELQAMVNIVGKEVRHFLTLRLDVMVDHIIIVDTEALIEALCTG